MLFIVRYFVFSGSLSLSRPLGFRTSYNLEISAIDGYNLKSTTDATVTINIYDGSQNPSTFESVLYKFEVDEDADVGTTAGTVTASGNSGETILANNG